jgi:hypothetical protein
MSGEAAFGAMVLTLAAVVILGLPVFAIGAVMGAVVALATRAIVRR